MVIYKVCCEFGWSKLVFYLFVCKSILRTLKIYLRHSLFNRIVKKQDKKNECRIKKGSAILNNPLYLNANLIFSMAFQWLKPKKPNEKKSGTITKLQEEGYQLVTSMLTKYETVKNLSNDGRLKISLSEANSLFDRLMNEYNIVVIASLDKKGILTDDFFTRLMKSDLLLNDALHIEIASRWSMKVCTHDKKMVKSSTQADKEKFYQHVYKADDLIKSRKKEN